MEVLYVIIVSFCLLKSTMTHSLSKLSGVRLEENGYSGIIVGVSSDVPENPRLVEIIKEMFVNASSDLYQATKRRAYFRDVTILLPPTWTGDQWDEGFLSTSYKNVDVTITQSRYALEEGSLDLPYTKQIEGCGKPGVSIYMTSQFLQDYQNAQQLYGNYGNILVHEWGHFRWGLFDEYPDEELTEGQNHESFYFSTKTQRWHPVGCSYQRKMVAVKRTTDNNADFNKYVMCEGNDVTGYEEGCVALPSARHGNINGSIMEGNLRFQELPMFCDSDPDDPTTTHHNSEAPNRQNLECGGRSSWEVMGEHEDFNDDKNPPRNITNLTPSFNVIRARPPRVMFVIDNSKEMKINDRMSGVTAAVNCFINNMIPNGTLAGLVVFGSHAYVLHDLQEIGRMDSGGKFENWLQVNVSSETDSSVEKGVKEALKVLRQQNENDGGKIVVITAAKGGNVLLKGTVEGQHLTRQGIVIDALIYNDAPADIFDIVDDTGGKVYLQTNSSGVEGLLEALYDVMSGTGLKFPLKTYENDGSRGEALARFCSIKKDDVISLNYSMPLSVNACPVEVYVRINWDAAAAVGLSGINPFAIYAQVHRCEDPIVDVEVTAIVERPTEFDSRHSIPFELKLLDNGAGADLRRHDGVYSRYFTEFTGPGIYGINVKANNHGTAKLLKHLRNRLPRSYVNGPLFAEDLLSGNFSVDDTVPFLPGEPIGDLEGETLDNFTRSTTGGATRITSSSPDSDTTPPAKITDLKIESQYSENATVTLTFTAPGDDLDFGYAFQYYIYISNTGDQLVNNASSTPLVRIEDIIEGNVSSPSIFGTSETFVIGVHLPSGIDTVSYYFGVIAEDDASNLGEMSTLVQAVFQNLNLAISPETLSTESVFTTTKKQYFDTETFTDDTTLTSQPISVTVTTKDISPTQSKFCQCLNSPGCISIGLVLIFVCLICVLTIPLLIIRKRRKQRRTVCNEDIEIKEQPTDQISNRT